jgi:serine phosphatase RsbU (regulator of sigma subunit)
MGGGYPCRDPLKHASLFLVKAFKGTLAEKTVDSGITIGVLTVMLATAVTLLAVCFIRARHSARRFEILHTIADVSDHSGTLKETLDAVCEIIVPELADLCVIDLIGPDGIERVAVRVGPGAGEDVVQGLAERRPSLPERMQAGSDSGVIEPRFIERMSEADLAALAHDGPDLEFLRGLEINSTITVALRARGRLTGALTLGVAWSGRRYRRDHADFASVLSGRVALTLDNAGLFSDLESAEAARAEIAVTLQNGLLPPPMPHIPGWSVAASYRPAGAENEVGGDFYDAFPAAGGWMLVIGDVTGRGARAASVTAQARYTLRTAAALTGDPLIALATLNRALLSRGDSALCSAAALAISEDPLQPARIAVAGHPPPLLVDGDAVGELADSGPVLGAFPDADWPLDYIVIEPGQQLVVVTDGIAEACGSEGRFGEERLRSELGGVTSPVQAVQRLEIALQSFTDGRLDDDVAILALTPASPRAHGGRSLSLASADPVAGLTSSGAGHG